jgi:peroxiredoxin
MKKDMKKNMKKIVLGLALAMLGFTIFKLTSRIVKRDKTISAIQRLPDFSFKTMADTTFSRAQLGKDAPVLVIFFSADCDHCQYEAREIKNNIGRLAHCNILMISPDPVERIRQFDSAYRLSAYPSVRLLRDDQDAFYRTFATRMIPSVFIYNRNGELTKEFLGEVQMDAIFKYL